MADSDFARVLAAGETLTALKVAVAWRYLQREDGTAAEALLRRIIAMLWKLTRG